MKYLFAAFCAVFLAATSLSAQSNYRIQPGDTLSIEVVEDPQLNRAVLVLPGGTINFPFAGTLDVGGRTASDVQQSIASGIASNFSIPPTVFVTVTSVVPTAPAVASTSDTGDTIDVYFVGEINQPGLRPMESGTTFLQAVAQSGGFTRFAATKRVQLRRINRQTRQQQIFKMNFRALGDGADIANDIVLQDGDVILVPERRLFE